MDRQDEAAEVSEADIRLLMAEKRSQKKKSFKNKSFSFTRADKVISHIYVE